MSSISPVCAAAPVSPNPTVRSRADTQVARTTSMHDGWLSDSLRHNHLATTGDAVLRLPSVGLRIDPGPYLTTIRRALLTRGWTP